MARMVATHRAQETWQQKVSRFIALTEFARGKFIEAGFPEDRLHVKPNFIADPGTTENHKRKGALFVGRLSEENGVATLLEAWRNLDYPLRIIGDGPLSKKLRTSAPPRVQFLGRREQNEVQQEMMNAAFLIMPPSMRRKTVCTPDLMDR